MDEESIQSIESNQEDETGPSILAKPYSDDLSLEEKIYLIRQDFANRFPSKEQQEMTRKENFLKRFPLLALLNRVKNIDESIENAQKDRASIHMLLDLYASQLIELDTKLEEKMSSIGEWLQEVMDMFIDGGTSLYGRYYTYKLLGHDSIITSNKYMRFNRNKTILLRIFFLSMILINCYLLIRSGGASGLTMFKIRKSLVLQLGSSILILINATFLIYAPAVDYWIRDFLLRYKNYGDEIAEQIRYHVADLNDFASYVSSIRQENSFQLQELIESSLKFGVQSSYDTYLSFNEIKTVFANEKLMSRKKQDMLLVLLGLRNLRHFFSDYGFAYWILRKHANKALVFFGAICVGFIYNYATIPFMLNISGFWQSFTGALAAEAII